MWKFTSFLLYLVTILVLGQTLLVNSFDCSNIEIDGIKFNLTSLDKTNIHNNTIESTPPTFTKYTYHINPCSPLSYDEKLEPEYKCEDGTYICQIVFNYIKEDGDGERATYIRPIAGGELKPTITLEPALNKDERNLSIILHGGTYNNEPQQANITFICVKDQDKDSITIAEYKKNTLFMKWETRAACGEKSEEDKGMGGFTKFIIILIVIGLCYFGLGAAYNYHVYKAHGWDLLPHLDFWRDFPYLISDVFKYLVNSVRTGSRGGSYSRI